MHLGMVPSWQYSSDPGVNIKLNPNVTFPPGMTQHTIQPVGSYFNVARIAQPNLGCMQPNLGCMQRSQPMAGLRGIGDHPGIIAAVGAGLVAVAGISLFASKRKRRRR